MDNFWHKLKKPIIGLSPMDGVTDAAFRFMVAKYAKPDVIFTEFVSAEGLSFGADTLLLDFLYSEIERPIVAQIFGSSPEAFFKVAPLLCELGFDGIDINMGCPDKNVAKKGGGAALILNPKLAKEIILKTKKGIKEWTEGRSLKSFGLPDNILNLLSGPTAKFGKDRREVPVSVKTRIGYDKVVIVDWVKHLLDAKPANISIHGRTLKQMYTGSADWEAIAKAAEVIKKTGTLVLGNGDVKSKKEAEKKAKEYGVDGVLIGRAAFGNPWVFSDKEPKVKEKLKIAVEHAKKFEEIFKNRKFYNIRKHLAWYSHGFSKAKELRIKLMKAENAKECELIINEFLSENP